MLPAHNTLLVLVMTSTRAATGTRAGNLAVPAALHLANSGQFNRRARRLPLAGSGLFGAGASVGVRGGLVLRLAVAELPVAVMAEIDGIWRNCF
jgi:hypothetical protein